MSAIAGVVDRGGSVHPEVACRQILAGLIPYGTDRQNLKATDIACFGHALYRVLPQDDFDRQPLVHLNGTMFVADARIDNRSEIITRLGLEDRLAREMSDSDILFLAWYRYRLDCVKFLLGDFVFAAWEGGSKSLIMVRSPLALKTLFFYRSSGLDAFSSTPAALFAVPQISKELDAEEAATIAGGSPFGSDRTMFRNVRRLLPGHSVILALGREETQRLWELTPLSHPPRDLAEAGDAIRYELRRAVREQSRRRSGPISVQLSAGRDSSAVASTAAAWADASNQEFHAITGAPRLNFSDREVAGRISDESNIAAVTMGAYPKASHHICRPDPIAVKEQFDFIHRYHFGPMLNTSNLPWWQKTVECAASLGSTILLTGQLGNFSISRGGADALTDVLKNQGVGSWWRVAKSLVRQNFISWSAVGNLTFGPHLPRALHAGLLRASGRKSHANDRLSLLRGSFRAHAERIQKAKFYDQRPWPCYREHVTDMIYRADNSDEVGIVEFGIEVRDPTADRRLVELCHSLSAEMLISATSSRPAYENAFNSRLPQGVIDGRRRGLQGADWIEMFSPQQLHSAVDLYAENSIVRDLFNIARIKATINCWPKSGGSAPRNIRLYGQELLNTLSMMSFVSVHFR